MDYVHWPMNDTVGVTPAKIQTVTFPDITFSGTTAGMWSNLGWWTGSGDLEGSTGDDADVKDFFDLSTLGGGLLIVAGWIKSPDFSGATSVAMWSYGSTDGGVGFSTRLTRVITAGAAPDLTRVQAQINAGSTQDLRGIDAENTNGAVFVMVVLRNSSGVTEECVLVDGIQTDGTVLEGAAWSTVEAPLEKGFTIGAKRFNNVPGTFNSFWRNGDQMKDIILVRSSNDVWAQIDVLCRDAWKAGGGIPQSWFDTL